MNSPRVLVIDNTQEELDQITHALHAALIPCLPVLYNSADWPSSAPPTASPSIRLVLLDLNLADATSPNARTIVLHTVQVLKHIISDGPYVLAFWSKHADIAEEVIELMRERYSTEVVPPIYWTAINKLDFVLPEDQIFREQQKNKLSKLVEDLLSKPSTLRALANWEARVMGSVASTVARLNKIAAAGNPWNFEETNNRLSNLLTWIAHEAVGRRNAKEYPSEAVEQGLVAALADDLSRSPASEDYTSAWRSAMPDLGSGTFAHDKDFASHLNQVFHIDELVPDVLARGTFRYLSTGVDTDARCKEIFGLSINALKGEFINISSVPKEQRGTVLNECRLGVVELSASCDYAQRKDRTYRFALAILIPQEYAEFSTFGDGDPPPKATKHDAVYRVPAFRVKGKAYICKLNFRHILGLPSDSPLLGAAFFRIRAPLLDEISYRCSSHLARPGIIAFN